MSLIERTFNRNEGKNQIDRRELIFLSLAFLFVASLIVAAARGDLWLDEIWSLSFAETASTPWEIFTNYKHDNNHVLNTLFLHLLGQQSNLFFYRFLSITSGIGVIFLIGYIARYWGRIESLFVVLMSGTSYPLVLYFSESRGYAPAIFFSILSFVSLTENWNRFRLFKLLVFWAAIIFGILSHTTFVIVILALLSFSLLHELHEDSPLLRRILRICMYYSVPFTFLILFYAFFIKNIHIGGGPVYTKWYVIGQTASLSLGFPDSPFFGIAAVACVVTIVAAGSYLLYRDGHEVWILFPVVMFIAPALFIAITQPKILYFRYFILGFPFFYLLLSYVLGRFYHSRFTGSKWMVIIIIVIFMIGQAQRLIPLLQLGRGNYIAALQKVSADSDEVILRIGSDHDFRNKMLITFYTRFLPDKKRFHYIDQKKWQRERPDWIITHSQDLSFQPKRSLLIPKIGKYLFIEEYRFSGISGWSWFLYRRGKDTQTENPTLHN